MKELFGSIAALLALVSGIIYIWDIYRGRTKPHLYTYIVWGLLTCVLFAGQWVGGGGPGSWAAAVAALLTIAVIPLCIKYGTNDITLTDGICLVAGCLCIIPWVLTKDPLLSVLLANVIDMWAMIPTLRKTWNAPRSESLSAWLLTEVKHIFVVLALTVYSPITWLYPVQAFSMNAVLIGIMVFRNGHRRGH